MIARRSGGALDTVAFVARAFASSALVSSALALAGCSAAAPSEQTPTSENTAATPAATPAASTTQGSAGSSAAAAEQKFPDIVAAELEPVGDQSRDQSEGQLGDQYRIVVTVSSPYDSAARYADGWRVLADDTTVLAEHTLTHDHASEQPFTRSRGPFVIPPGVETVTVEGHDQHYGYGGGTVTIAVPR